MTKIKWNIIDTVPVLFLAAPNSNRQTLFILCNNVKMQSLSLSLASTICFAKLFVLAKKKKQ